MPGIDSTLRCRSSTVEERTLQRSSSMTNEVTAQPTEKPKVDDDELSQAPEDLGKHVLEGATEAGTLPTYEAPDGTVEVMVPPNQTEEEEEEDETGENE